MIRWGICVAVASCVAASASLVAQQRDSTYSIPNIVVTATRVPIDEARLATRVTVLSGAMLRSAGYVTVADALRRVPSVDVVSDGPYGAQTSVFLRGGESDYVQVLVDGIPLNDPGGAYDFANLTLANVQRIEIVRGPTSVLYGSDAVTGVIQIFTRHGGGPLAIRADARGGTYGTSELSASATGGSGAAAYALAVRRFASDGIYAFNNQYGNTAGSGHFTLRPDARTHLDLSVRYHDADYHYPTDGSGAVVDHNAFQTSRVTTVGVDVARAVRSGLDAHLLLSVNRSQSNIDDRQDGPADTLGFYGYQSEGVLWRASADARANARLGSAVLTAGVALEREHQTTSSATQSQYGPSSDASDAARLDRAGYVQALAKWGSLAVNAGARLDVNSTFGTFGTYRGGASWAISPNTRVYASVGTGFKEPTFFENFGGGYVRGNGDLRPERSFSWEAGIEHVVFSDHLRLAATFFDQHFRDLIQYTGTPPSPTDPNYFNIAGANARGVEMELTARVGWGFTLHGSTTWLDTKVTDAGFATAGSDPAFVTGEPLLRRPAHAGAVSLTYDGWSRLTFDADVDAVGARADADYTVYPAARRTLPAYALLNVGGELTLLPASHGHPGLTLTARIENAFDHDYDQVLYFPARGRTVMVGGKVGL